MKTPARILGLTLTLIGIVSAILYLGSETSYPSAGKVVGVGDAYVELSDPSGFLNSDTFELSDFIGEKVILVDFWTYTCINCQRTTPYLNAWWEKYKEDGLLIVGVHSPEFEFEKDPEKVATAVADLGIEYPVVLDNDHATWNAYGNRYWPRKYLIDLNGKIIYDHIGEGAYEETEAEIQKSLGLTEEMSQPSDMVKVDWGQALSPEIYLGTARAEFIQKTAEAPQSLKKNAVYLVGDWKQANESASPGGNNDALLMEYTAKNVYMVAGAATPTEVDVYVDGIYLKTITVQKETLYPLVQGTEYGTHTLKLLPKSTLEIFTLTFG